MRIDLHTHTTASDGKLTPKELLEYAKKKGLSAVAITDHDQVAGAVEAKKYINSVPMELIIGVEINTVWRNREIHMLGYLVDPQNPKLLNQLNKQREMRRARSKKILERLQEMNVFVSSDEVLEEFHIKKISDILLPHIAELMVKKGYVSTKQEAFDRYIGKGKPAYVLPTALTPIQAIKLIHESGGIAVVAHPGLYQDVELPDLVDAGLDGIEVYHPDHGAVEREKYKALAKQYELLITGGSDFHGEQDGKMYHGDLGSQAGYLAEDLLERMYAVAAKK